VVEFIDRSLPTVVRQQRDTQGILLERAHVGIVAAVVEMVDQLPQELLPSDATRYTELLSSVAVLRAGIVMWQNHGSTHTISNMTGGYSPMFIVRRALEGLPDSITTSDTDDLAFLADEPLIHTLRSDISTAISALRNGEWKAATVMAGSVIEALLLWSITQHGEAKWTDAMSRAVDRRLMKMRRDDPEWWHLADYIEVAGELGCVTDSTRTSARLTKEYRNLIHAGRVQRTGANCDLGTAHIAVGAMDHVVRELTARGAEHAVSCRIQ
jgi:hypothetical protein